jgi:hypothetical protein
MALAYARGMVMDPYGYRGISRAILLLAAWLVVVTLLVAG